MLTLGSSGTPEYLAMGISSSTTESRKFDIKSLNVVVGRGGMLKPIPGGTYAVSEELLADLKAGVQGVSERLVRMTGTLVPVRMHPFFTFTICTMALYTRLPAWISGKSSTSASPWIFLWVAPLCFAASASIAGRHCSFPEGGETGT